MNYTNLYSPTIGKTELSYTLIKIKMKFLTFNSLYIIDNSVPTIIRTKARNSLL